MHESARAPFSAPADAVWRCTSSACTRNASRVHSACRAGACCSITAPLHHPQPTPAAEGGALRSRWHALGGTLSVARSLWLAEQHIATTAGSVRQVCAHRSCRGLTCPRPPQRVVRSEWRHTRCQYKSGSWPRAVRASLDRVSRVEGGGACCRWRLHRHEPRGGGRDAPCGVSRGHFYGVRRRVRSPALLRWLLRWIWPSLVRYPCPGGLHCHVRHATWPLETALQLEAGWGPYLSSTEGLEALPGLPRETG